MMDRIEYLAAAEENPEVLEYTIEELDRFLDQWDEGILAERYQESHE